MEFARSGTGAMVKRLHLGRAAEAGVVAASLASDGFTGPRSVLEGPAGFLHVFCPERTISHLTHGLGTEFDTRRLCLKRFPMHMTAHTPVQAVMELQAEYGFTGAEVDRVTVDGSERMTTTNNIREPADVMLAQYSIPFCVALALFRDPRDPASFDDGVVRDPDIRGMCARVTMRVADPQPKVAGASTVTIVLKDGRVLTRTVEEFNGTPARPLSRAELRDKFVTLTRARYGAEAGGLFDRLQSLEDETDLLWVGA